MKRGTLPLHALRALEATLRHGQMRLAADELGVTHSAVSRQVRGLEASLGVRLFEGPRNKLRPSPEALALRPALSDAFDGIETALARLGRRRSLGVSCLGTLAMRWLIPRMPRFQALHPEIDLCLTTDHEKPDFARQRIDVAIRVGVGPWGGTRAMVLFPDAASPVLSPALVPGGRFGAGDLGGMTGLHAKTRSTAWADWSFAWGAAPPAKALEFEHFYFMLEAATAGLGVAIAPEVLVRDDLAAGRLVAPFGFTPSGMSYVALRPEGNSDAEAFVTWLGQAD